jgi:hypothetical protein
MKTTLLSICTAGVSLMATISSSLAMPFAGNDIDLEYAYKAQNLAWLSAGIWGGSTKREITWDNGRDDILKARPIDIYISAQVKQWLDVMAIIGSRDSEFQYHGDGNRKAEWGLGLQARLFSHEIPEVALMTDTIRITANASWVTSSTELTRIGTYGGTYASSVDWDEISISLLLGLYNHTTHNKMFGPETVGIYLGPGFSSLSGGKFKEAKSGGMIAGIQLFMTETVGLELQGQFFGGTSVYGGLTYQF